MSESENTIWVTCASCGGNSRKHKILFQTSVDIFENENEPPTEERFHRLVECMGCESIKYVTSSRDFLGRSDNETEEEYFKVYPDAPGKSIVRREAAISLADAKNDAGGRLIPEAVWKMYRETLIAFNANILTLAGGGLRAVVEAICLDKKIDGKNLEVKIDELVTQGFLAPVQAGMLHEERYLGNASLHEIRTPSAQDIIDGLVIVEGLINAIYILPHKTKRMKASREAKERTKNRKKSTKTTKKPPSS